MNNLIRRMALFLILLLALPASTAIADGEGQPTRLARAYRSMILNTDFGEDVTYVIGHRHPDSDTVSAAMAYANLLNALGVKAQAAVAGDINNETRYALECFGIEPPQVIDDATDRQFVLVDHSAYTHAIDEMPLARIVGVLDHHGIGSVQNSEFISVRSAPVGSTATLVYLSYLECEVPISRDMARIMLMGILSDTKNLTSNTTAMDQLAGQDLTALSDIEDVDALYRGMQEAAANYDGMSDIDIYMTDYKEYTAAGLSFGVGDVRANGEAAMAQMCDRMLSAMAEHYESIGLDMLFVKVNNVSGNEGENQSYMVAYPETAQALLGQCFGDFDGKYLVFREYQSRKKAIIPALTAALEAAGPAK